MMKLPVLNAHTIKIMNEQGCAKKQGTQYINTRSQGFNGELVFSFDKVLRGMPSRYHYALEIILVSAEGNRTKLRHTMHGDELQKLYEYVSYRCDNIVLQNAIDTIHELNSHYEQFETIL